MKEEHFAIKQKLKHNRTFLIQLRNETRNFTSFEKTPKTANLVSHECAYVIALFKNSDWRGKMPDMHETFNEQK